MPFRSPAGEPLSGVDFLDDDHVVVSGKTGRLEMLELSGRHPGPPLTASDVIHRVDGSPRWRVVNGRVVERPQVRSWPGPCTVATGA